MLHFGHKSETPDGAVSAPAIAWPPEHVTPDATVVPAIKLETDSAAPRVLWTERPAGQAKASAAPALSTSATAAGGLKPAAGTARRGAARGALIALSAHSALALSLLLVLPTPGAMHTPQEKIVELEIITSPSQVAMSEGERGQEPVLEPVKIAIEMPPLAPEPVFPPPDIAPPEQTALPTHDFSIELPPPAPEPVFAIAPPRTPVTATPKPAPLKLDEQRQRALAHQREKERERQQARIAEIARKKAAQQKTRAADQKRARAQQQERRRAGEAARAQQAARASAGRAAAAIYATRVVSKLRGAQYYPPAARARNARGVAVVSFAISPSGAATAVRIARSSGDRDLDSAALGTVRRASPFPAPPPGASRSFSAPMRFSAR